MNGDWVNRRTITLSGLDKKFRTSEAGGSPGERGSISGPDRKIGTCTGNGLTQTGTSSRFRFFWGVVDPTWLDFGSRLVDLGSCRAQIYSRVSASPRNGDQMYCRVSVTHRLLTGTPVFPGPNVFQGASYSPERGPSLFQDVSYSPLLTGTPIFQGPNLFQGATYSPEWGPNFFQDVSYWRVTHRYSHLPGPNLILGCQVATKFSEDPARDLPMSLPPNKYCGFRRSHHMSADRLCGHRGSHLTAVSATVGAFCGWLACHPPPPLDSSTGMSSSSGEFATLGGVWHQNLLSQLSQIPLVL